ncbi:hypothetical protein TrCOL_g8651 [Triparma columacea]|uniref:(S)-ureidoglycine aminohydrolase cupin domain-containing protein n=1 Tax=Triparma columacea TaxID=722753 RepID=A0A9W7FYK3_9STRA|nr:hypothetical protein TrCOL_g8651 [Triparma columacea]
MSLQTLSSADIQAEKLDSWGFRAGAKVEGTCAISGKSISKADGVSTGIWECEPGEFDVPNRPNVESVMILKGYVKLTDMDSGSVKELRAGDAATLEKGSSVKWEVIETCRKFYVIA